MSATHPLLPATGEPLRRKYSAFISYRHADNHVDGRRWATWLHEGLESFEVSPRVAGKVDRDGGKVPATLFPVFRDEKELAADASLDRAIREALEASDVLILIASPRAALSPHVDGEVAYFAALGRANRIITVVIDGVADKARKPGAVGEECFPPALLALLRGNAMDEAPADDGERRRSGPLWVDLRAPGIDGAPPEEGWTSMGSYLEHLTRTKKLRGEQARPLAREYAAHLREQRLRIIAGVLNVTYGTLRRETNEFEVRKLRRLLKIVAVVAGLFLGLAWIANEQRLEANRQRTEAEQQRAGALHANGTANGLVNEMLYDLGDKLVPLGRLELLEKVASNAEDYFAGLSAEELDRDGGLGYARALIKRGEVMKAGAVSKDRKEAKAANAGALARYEKALQLLGSIPAQTPVVKLDTALACERVADMLEDNQSDQAIATARRGIALIAELEAGGAEIVNGPGQRLKGQLYERLGDLLEDNARDLAGAEEAFRDSHGTRRALHESEPENGLYTRDYGVSLGRLGDIYLADGRWKEARTTYMTGLEVRRDLVRAQGLNAAWQSEVSRSYYSLADAEIRLGRLEDAREHFEEALRIRRLLADFDPPNDRWQGDVIRALVMLSQVDWLDWTRLGAVQGGELLESSLARLHEAEKICALLERDKRWADKLMLEAAGVQARLGTIQVARQQMEAARKAVALGREYLETAIRERKGKLDDKIKLVRARLAQAEVAVARLKGDHAAVEKHLRAAYADWKELAEEDPRQYEVREDWAICAGELAQLLREMRPDSPDLETYAGQAKTLVDELKHRRMLDLRGKLFLVTDPDEE